MAIIKTRAALKSNRRNTGKDPLIIREPYTYSYLPNKQGRKLSIQKVPFCFKFRHQYLVSFFPVLFKQNSWKLVFFTNRFLAAAARSLWRLFLNQLPTCVGVSPVAWASSRFLVGFG
jgi:hypothetical protein